MKIFLDTNVLLDHALRRDGFFEDAKSVIKLCLATGNDGYIAFHSITNMYYIMNRSMKSSEVESYITALCGWVHLGPASLDSVREGIILAGDLEDHLQWISARDACCDVLVTRDPRGFVGADESLEILAPGDFLSRFQP